jgi:hypothetical protein
MQAVFTRIKTFEAKLTAQMGPLLTQRDSQLLKDKVVDMLSKKHIENQVEVTDLVAAVEEMQIKLKDHMFTLVQLQEEVCQFKGREREMLQDSLNLQKIALVGCKMRVYQERLRTGSFMEILARAK